MVYSGFPLNSLYMITQLAAEPKELELWEWSHSTAFTTLIILPPYFFRDVVFINSNNEKIVILGQTAVAKTTTMECRYETTIAPHTGPAG